MSSTDDRIVRMQFDNASFKKGAADTQKSLADLNKAVDSSGKSKGLMDMSSQMQQVSVTASKMSIATTAALATIVSKATSVGINLARALTLDPVKAGFTEYEALLTKQNVIMNATGKSATVVKGFLSQLNTYSDKTIYNFGNMTDSIQKFVNAGVPLPQAVTSIKGIANAAAFAGASAQEANRGMYAFSQSMQTGFIMLNDWMQIENANMGTIKFKEQLLEAGVAAGTLTKKGKEYITTSGKAITATKGWREGLQEQWATTEVLNDTLGKYADTNTKLGKAAFQSATEVRTFTAFMDTLKESLASGWAAVFTSLFGNLNQATKMWTGLAGAVDGTIGTFFDFIGTSLKVWRTMGGFEKTLGGFKNLLSPIGALLGVIGKAWSQAFPDSGKGAGKAIYGLSVAFELITRPLTLLADLISGTTPILTVFFSALKLGSTIVSRVSGMIGGFVKDLLGLAEVKVPSGAGFIGFVKELAKALTDAINKVEDLISKGTSIGAAFGAVDFKMPSMPSMPSIPKMPSLGGLFGADGASKSSSQLASLSGGVKDLTAKVFDLKDSASGVTKTALFNPSSKLDTSRFDQFSGSLKEMVGNADESGEQVKSIGVKIGETFGNIKDAVLEFVKKIDANDVVRAFNAAVFATMGIEMARFVNTMRKGFEGFMGMGEAFNGVVTNMGGALKSFQTAARAKLITAIALALLALAAALFILSLIPADKLAISLGALAAVALIMSKTMKSMGATIEKMDGAKAGIKMLGLSVAITALAFSMILLATAFLIMNKVEWQSVAKGIITMFVAMKLVQSIGSMAKGAAGNMAAAGLAIMLVAAAMVVLAGALLLFKLVDWEDMGKAGAALGGLTLAVGALALIPYAGIAKVGLALLGASLGMLALANALIMFGLVSWESIGKAAVVLGLLTISLGLLMFVANPMSVGMFLALGAAMLYLSFALMNLNDVDWSSIGKLALVMGVLLLALLGLTGVLYLLAPVIPILLIFAAGMFLLGLALLAFAGALAIAMALAAVGVAAFAALGVGAAVAIAAFMQTLAAEAPVMKKAFLTILQNLIDTIVEAVPMIIDGIKRLWAAVKKEFTSPDKKKSTGDAGKSWVASLADGIAKKLPEIIAKGSQLIVSFLKGLASKASAIAAAGVSVVVAVINGISRKIGDVVAAAVNLIIRFAKGIQEGLNKIVEAGIQLIGTFLHRLADAIRGGSGIIGGGLADVISAFGDVGRDMIQGLIDGVGDMFAPAMSAIRGLADAMVEVASTVLEVFSPSRVFKNIGKFLVQGLTLGIQNNAASAVKAVASMIRGQIAISEDLINGFMQRLDQRSIAARAKAEGLAAAAKRAQTAANRTKKVKSDDKAADRLSGQAKRADRTADAAEKRVQCQRAANARRDRWQNADALERAKIRAADAQRQIASAKAAEKNAAAARIEANALDKQARAKGVTAQQSKVMRKEADRLRRQARENAVRANKQIRAARGSAVEAMKWQKVAGKQAATNFQKQFDAEAKADADAEAFEKLSVAEKAAKRRKEAAALEIKAKANLARAKKLAFKDIERANAVAQLAMEQAERARNLLDEAADFEEQAKTETPSGQIVDLQLTDAAALAFNQYADLYDSAYAAAASIPTVEFNQYNTSPESLNPGEIYRQTNNLVTYAADKLTPSPN